MLSAQGLQFVPSRVEGLPEVTEVTVHPDRLEVISAGTRRTFHFVEITRWPWPSPFWRYLFRHGWRPRWLPVGGQEWFHPPSERFFRFYTTPRIVVFMADEPQSTSYGDTLFFRVQLAMREGGFHSWDLG